ncbi:MAG: CDP-glucose 4,6-dehydratase [Proteobacteria bacterium]|nr:CDP-glucose 4,6-dehydratase [Pseudomonadota bacterium]
MNKPWGDKFAGARVLVTGDTGFKGSWLSLWLSNLKAEVFGFSLPPEGEAPLFHALGLEDIIDHTDGDIRDLDGLKRVFRETSPEIVFHLAAQSLVYRSYKDPKRTFDTNVGGAVNLLEAVRDSSSVKAVVFITSDKCYENSEWDWGYREIDRLGGRDPYSSSKAAAELVFAAYNASYFSALDDLSLATARAGNVIGGGDFAEDRIVPDCIRGLQADGAITLRNPSATRPWQHVLEPLSGYLTLACHLLNNPEASGSSWNFGPSIDNACTVGELADRIVTAWGEGKIIVDQPNDAPYESTLLHLNTDKARLKLDWHQRWDIDRTVSETTRWYSDVANGIPAIDISRRQIAAYEES